MPIPILPRGELSPIGALAFGDIHAILGKQIQPSFVWTDMVAGTSPDYVRYGTSLRIDRVAGVAHSPIIYVPHHQSLAGTTSVDGGVYAAARLDLPVADWTLVTSGDTPSAGTSNVTFQSFPDRHYQNEWLSYSLKSSSARSVYTGIVAHLKCTRWKMPSGGAYVDNDEQGFTLFFSHFSFGGVDNTHPAEVEVWWKIHAPGDPFDIGVTAKLILSSKVPPRLYLNGILVRDASNNTSPLGTRGSHSLGNTNVSPSVQVLMVGGKMQIMVTGSSEPMIVHLDRLLRADVEEFDTGTVWKLAQLTRFPNQGKLWFWRGGSNPSFAPGWRGDLTETSIVDEDPGYIQTTYVGDLKHKTVAILEPRIGEVHLVFKKITHASWSLSPARWLGTWAYTSIQQQLAFTPRVTTPWYYTTHTPGDWRETISGETWEHGLYPGSSITVTDGAGIAGSEIHQFTISASCPNLYTYNGDQVSRYTIGVNRVDCRIEGIQKYESPNITNTTSVLLEVERTPQSDLVNEINSQQNFDINTLQVTNNLDIQLDNYNGKFLDLERKLGIAGIGAIGVMFRWGWLHQDRMGYAGNAWFGSGAGPGFARYVGSCDSYQYSGRKVRLFCQDDFTRVRNYQMVVPPLIDQWNHYRAVYTLLQMAGVPEARIGFMDKVPSSPTEVSVNDPDYDTGGYILPVGVGSNPWTPIYSSITVGALLAQIQQVTGCVMYCDAYGTYQYEPFLRSTPAGVPKRVFRTYDVLDSNGAPVQYHDEVVSFTNRDVRNKVVLIGIDAYGPGNLDPIIVKIEDIASIDSPVGGQPINYTGFAQPFVWIDSRFASLPFAFAAGTRIYESLRIPTIEVTFSCTGGQPDIYVMDWIILEHFRSGLTGFPATPMSLPLFVTGVVQSLKKTPAGAIATTTITARYINPGLAQNVNGVIS